MCGFSHVTSPSPVRCHPGQSQRSPFTFPGRSNKGFCFEVSAGLSLKFPGAHQSSTSAVVEKQVLCGGRRPGGWGAPGPAQGPDLGIGCPAPSRGHISLGPLTLWGARDTGSRSVGPAEIRPSSLMPLRPDTLARAAPWEDSNSVLVAHSNARWRKELWEHSSL